MYLFYGPPSKLWNVSSFNLFISLSSKKDCLGIFLGGKADLSEQQMERWQVWPDKENWARGRKYIFFIDRNIYFHWQKSKIEIVWPDKENWACGRKYIFSSKEIYIFHSQKSKIKIVEIILSIDKNKSDRCGQTKKTEHVEGNIYFHW